MVSCLPRTATHLSYKLHLCVRASMHTCLYLVCTHTSYVPVSSLQNWDGGQRVTVGGSALLLPCGLGLSSCPRAWQPDPLSYLTSLPNVHEMPCLGSPMMVKVPSASTLVFRVQGQGQGRSTTSLHWGWGWGVSSCRGAGVGNPFPSRFESERQAMLQPP